MGTQSKRKHRPVDFSGGLKMLSDSIDQKLMANMHHITTALSQAQVRIETLEDLLMEKLGETEASLKERVLLRVEKKQGFEEVTTPVVKGSVVRIKAKESDAKDTLAAVPYEDAFMVVGHNQIHADVDAAAIGMKAGESKDLILTQGDKTSYVTFMVAKVFRGEESQVKEAVQEEVAPVAAQSQYFAF